VSAETPDLRYGPVRYARTGTQTTWWAVKPALRLHGPAEDGFRPSNFRTKKTAHCAAKHPSPDRTANGVKVPCRSTHIREDSSSDDGAMSDAGAMVKPNDESPCFWHFLQLVPHLKRPFLYVQLR
jgi:hypothetical protein